MGPSIGLVHQLSACLRGRAFVSGRPAAAQDTFYVGTMKGVGRIYQQTHRHLRPIASPSSHDRKSPHRGRSPQRPRGALSDQHEVRLCRVLTDRGTEYCGNPEHHEYELYLAVEDMDHSQTKTKSPKQMESSSASTKQC